MDAGIAEGRIMAGSKTAGGFKGMVSTASKPATEAGVLMLKKGGNVVDAAVAAAFCLGVIYFAGLKMMSF